MNDPSSMSQYAVPQFSLHPDRFLSDGEGYLAGYSVFRKSQCEIHNFISPTFRVLRFLEGSSDWKVDGRLQTFSAGDIVLLSNQCKRNIDTVHGNEIVYEMIDFYPTVFMKPELSRVFYASPPIICTENMPIHREACDLIDQIRTELFRETELPYRRSCIRYLLSLFAILMLRNFQNRLPEADVSNIQLSRSLQYIVDHLSEKLTVSQLAEAAGYTPEHYSRLFRRYFGMTPLQYIISCRIENTLFLVRSRGMTVLDAAYQSGFQSASAFYKSFRQYRNTTPTQCLTDQ